MTFSRLMRLKKGFPLLEELILTDNHCSDFDSINLEEGDFAHLRVLDLTENRISSDQPIPLLARFQNLENLNLTGNLLTDVSEVCRLGQLKTLNLHENRISEICFINDLAKLTRLESIRISENPVLKNNDSVHVKYLATASLPNIRIMNGTNLKPHEIKDCQIYYWRNPFHEHFANNNINHNNFIFTKLYQWARAKYAMFEFYVRKFDVPYDCEEQMNYLQFLEMSDEELEIETQRVETLKEEMKKQKMEEERLEKERRAKEQEERLRKAKERAEFRRKDKEAQMMHFKVDNTKKSKPKKTKKTSKHGTFCKITFLFNEQSVENKIPFKLPMTFVKNFAKKKFKYADAKTMEMKVVFTDHDSGEEVTKDVTNYSMSVAEYINAPTAIIQILV